MRRSLTVLHKLMWCIRYQKVQEPLWELMCVCYCELQHGHYRGSKWSFTGSTAQPGGYFGEGINKPAHLEMVQCIGSERDLTECEKGEIGSNTTHSLDVGVKCQPGIVTIYRSLWGYWISLSQLMAHIERGMFVWWKDLETGRGEWKCSGREDGELLLTLTGLTMMPGLFAGSCAIPHLLVWLQVIMFSSKDIILSDAAVQCCDTYGNGSGLVMTHSMSVVCKGGEQNITECDPHTSYNISTVGVKCEQGWRFQFCTMFGVTAKYRWWGELWWC